MSESITRSWWAGSRGRSRGTIAAATVLVAALTGVSIVVWTSPEVSPIQQTIRAAEEVQEAVAAAEDREGLLARIDALEAELEGAYEGEADAQAALAASQAEVTLRDESLQAVLDELAIAQQRPAAGRNPVAAPKQQQAPAPAPVAPAQPVTAPSRDELVAPSAMYYGMYTEQAPHNWATLDSTALKAGGLPSMVGYFGGWDEEFRPDAVQRAWGKGMMPMLTWESRPIDSKNDVVDEPEYSLPLILSGAFDEYLHRYARSIADTGLPLAMRLNHEMNGTWYPWSERNSAGNPINGNRVGDYAAVWRHVHDIFEAEGANEYVIWVWAPNRIDKLPSHMRAIEWMQGYYPGDEYVDWVGMSGYLRPPYGSGEQYTFDATFGATLAQLRQLSDKPIILAEVGASEIEGHKPEWVRSYFAALGDPANSDIVGFAWFSLAVTTYVGGERATNDWRIDSRADSLAAFRDGLAALGARVQVQPTG